MDIDPSSVIANRGLNLGYGYGAFNQGNFGGDGSAINANVRGNRDLSLLESVNSGTRDQFLSAQIRQHNDAITDTINMNNQFTTDRIAAQGLDFKFANITAQHAALERLMFANQAATDRRMSDIDLKLTECCCELKAGQAAILAKLDADRATAAQNEVNILRIQLANQSNGPGNS